MFRVQDISSKHAKANYITTLDLRAGYHDIALDDAANQKTAVVTQFCRYDFSRVPFRLAMAQSYFQQLMLRCLNVFAFTIAYLDDIIIFSETA